MWCPTRLCSWSFVIPNLYIIDFHNSSAIFSFYLFPDDTILSYSVKNLKSLEETVNSELVKVSGWLNANKLTLNAKKSNFVIFSSLPTKERKMDRSVNTVWHEIFAGGYFCGLTIFCVLRELIFPIFRRYPVPSIDDIFLFIEYVQWAYIFSNKKNSISLHTVLFLNERDKL